MSKLLSLYAQLDEYGRKRIVTVYGVFAVYGLFLFLGAGTLCWTAGWFYLLGGIACTSLAIVYLADKPEVINARGRHSKPTHRWDKIIMSFYAVHPLATLALAGADVVRWRSAMPISLRAVGWALYVFGMVMVYWAMGANPHLEPYVRIQSERHHTVADSGPYRCVRHPMYVGILASMIGTPLILGSWWALALAAVGWGLIIARTALEDRMLQRELPGYAEYAQRTSARLFPRVW